MDSIFPTSRIKKSKIAKPIPYGQNIQLPESFSDRTGKEISTSKHLKNSDTTGLMVVKSGKVVHESYELGHSPATQHICWSVTKSITSILIGRAIDDGLLSLDEKLGYYVPALKKCGYGHSTIRDALKMASGVRWNEEYGEFFSDINKFGRVFALGMPLDTFVGRLVGVSPPGTTYQYNTMDTQALSMVLRKVLPVKLERYLEDVLWTPLEMEDDAYFIVDNLGTPFTGGGLCTTLRSLAKIGLLYLNRGEYKGNRIISEDWIKKSLSMESELQLPGNNPNPDLPWGFGLHWWLMDGDQGDFLAAGIYGQYIYVSPKQDCVIIKNSANRNHGLSKPDDTLVGVNTVELFRKIAECTG